MKDNQVNVGTKENPILVPRNQVIGENTSFWRGVASGSVLVGKPGGIDLDKALQIGMRKGKNHAQSNSSR